LVQAGRQCWPGDENGMINTVAARPHDVMADQWIYNLVSGGNQYEVGNTLTNNQVGFPDFMDIHLPQSSVRDSDNVASTFDFKYNEWDNGTGAGLSDLDVLKDFDDTFVDVDADGQPFMLTTDMASSHGVTHGFYKDPWSINQLPHVSTTPPKQATDYWTTNYAADAAFAFIAHPSTDVTPAASASVVPTFTNPVPNGLAGSPTGRLNLYQQRFLQPQLPIGYTNGMMFTSKCFQCCNSGFNCNANWLPKSEADWSWNDIRGHRYNEDNDATNSRMRHNTNQAGIDSNDATGTFMAFLQEPASGV
jgi:hypothetical protein